MKYHLLNDFGVYKSSIKNNFHDNDRESDNPCHELLARRTQSYTIPELEELFGYLWTSHDDCVDENPEDYHHLEVYQSRKKIKFGQKVYDILKKLKETNVEALFNSRCIKETEGTFTQVFDKDGNLVNSGFYAGDESEYRAEFDGHPCDLHEDDDRNNFYHPFDTAPTNTSQVITELLEYLEGVRLEPQIEKSMKAARKIVKHLAN